MTGGMLLECITVMLMLNFSIRVDERFALVTKAFDAGSFGLLRLVSALVCCELQKLYLIWIRLSVSARLRSGAEKS